MNEKTNDENIRALGEMVVTLTQVIKTRAKYKDKIERYINRLPYTKIVFTKRTLDEYEIITEKPDLIILKKKS